MKLLILFLVTCALVSGYIFMYNKAETLPTQDSTEQLQEPTERAPEGAFSSCIDKTEGDACIFIIAEVAYDGVCQDIMGTLTCGPTFPDGSY